MSADPEDTPSAWGPPVEGGWVAGPPGSLDDPDSPVQALYDLPLLSGEDPAAYAVRAARQKDLATPPLESLANTDPDALLAAALIEDGQAQRNHAAVRLLLSADTAGSRDWFNPTRAETVEILTAIAAAHTRAPEWQRLRDLLRSATSAERTYLGFELRDITVVRDLHPGTIRSESERHREGEVHPPPEHLRVGNPAAGPHPWVRTEIVVVAGRLGVVHGEWVEVLEDEPAPGGLEPLLLRLGHEHGIGDLLCRSGAPRVPEN